ncbi:C-GCAxxG-C-C family (seleno)protein [Clostridium arbusti]|uniref:C-GCAxxG-C-C family (seleno)protein n=1 Tax=Clostridium arbusti TaxID=1137848 RepID=UPI001FB16B4A|nr:C-GCAxxG-C-C family (seleno)protein [Clostridium arbusti]
MLLLFVDYVKKYYGAEYDLNCAETILYAANDRYDLNLDKKALKSVAAFGGGMGIGDVCGAITGSLAVLGIIFVEDRAHESIKIKKLSMKFFERFQSILGGKNCIELKDKFATYEERCSKIMYTAAEVLEQLIDEYK